MIRRAKEFKDMASECRALAGAAALFLFLIVVGLALSTALIWREKEKTQAERDRFEGEKLRAEGQEQRAREEARVAKEQRRQADRERERAEDLLKLGLATLDVLYLDVAEHRLLRAQARSHLPRAVGGLTRR